MPREPRKPATTAEAVEAMRESEPTAEELRDLGEEAGSMDPALDDPAEEKDARETPQVTRQDFRPDVDPSAVPAWVKIPQDLEFPPHGVTWTAMLFEPEWTDRPHLGPRQCIIWNLSVGDEKFARRRARGDADAVMDEQAKQMIRAIDGRRIDWGNPSLPNSPDRFWDEIGKKCRMLVLNHFMQTHSLEKAERLHFFTRCLAVRTVAPSPTRQAPKTPGRGRSTRTT